METPRIVKVLRRTVRGWLWLRLRGPLPNGAVVIRGGLMKPATLIGSARDHFREFEEYALSSYSCAGRSADELAVLVGPRLPYAKIRESTVAAIRDLGQGYDVVPWGRNCYGQIRLPGPPDEESMIQLAAVFAVARPKLRQGG